MATITTAGFLQALEITIRDEVQRLVNEMVAEEEAKMVERIKQRVREVVAGIGVRVAGQVDFVNDGRQLIISIREDKR